MKWGSAAPEVGVLAGPEAGPAEHRPYGLLAVGRRVAEGAEEDDRQQRGPQGAVVAEAARRPLAAGVEEGTIRSDVGVGAVMMLLPGICTTFERPDARADTDGAVTVTLDGLRAPGRDFSPARRGDRPPHWGHAGESGG